MFQITFRQSIADYKVKQLGVPPEMRKNVTIDKTLIMHENNVQVWLIGEIETATKHV